MYNIKFNVKNNTQDVELGEEQKNALLSILTFINSSNMSITLSGAAGTGKTTLVKELLMEIDKLDIIYTLAAPTHKAKLVLENLSGEKAYTLHQLLALQPNLNLFDLDLRDLDFFSSKSKSSNMIERDSLIIIDEASMINDELYDFIIKKAKAKRSKILWVGDIKQLCPVGKKGLSKVFENDNIIILSKIYRQKEDSPVLDLLTNLRENADFHIQSKTGNEDNIYTYDDTIKFLKASKPYLKDMYSSGNVLDIKLLAHTNNRVNSFNLAARKLIFGKDCENELNENEILTAYDNYKSGKSIISNSSDYIITNTPKKELFYIAHFNTGLVGYKLNLYDTVEKTNNNITLLSKDNDPKVIDKLASLIDNTRTSAVASAAVGIKAKALWAKYYMLMDSFTVMEDLFHNNRVVKRKTFDYGYAMTIYKSQGSGFNRVFIDLTDINIVRDLEQIRQLQYVGISRTKGDVYILNGS